MIIKFDLFEIKHPLKVKINDGYGVLISSGLMDSINLKYLRYNVLYGKANTLFANRDVLINTIEQKEIKLTALTSENSNLKLLASNEKAQAKNSAQLYENQILFLKEKAKGKFRAFLFGTSIGATIVALLFLLIP